MEENIFKMMAENLPNLVKKQLTYRLKNLNNLIQKFNSSANHNHQLKIKDEEKCLKIGRERKTHYITYRRTKHITYRKTIIILMKTDFSQKKYWSQYIIKSHI